MFHLQIQFNPTEGWVTIQEVANLNFGLYRIAYFFENWEQNDYRLINTAGEVVSLGNRRSVCNRCHYVKNKASEFYSCYTCLDECYDD